MPKRRNSGRKAQRSIGLPEDVWELIDHLASIKPPIYGDTGTEVARNFILHRLQEVAGDRLLKSLEEETRQR